MPKKVVVHDLRTAVNAANAFYSNAANFFSKLPNDLESANKFVAQRLGRLIAAVTNLSLSIELYLKALAIGSRSRVLQTHDLLRLFDALPAALRNSIEKSYTSKLESLPRVPAAVELLITATPDAPRSADWDHATKAREHGHELRSLLFNETDAFRTWRYMHEAEPKGVRYYHVDYFFLNLFVHTLLEHIGSRQMKDENLQGPPSDNLPNG